MKFVIYSIALHIFIFIFGFSLNINKNYEIDNIGNDFNTPSISVNFNSFQPSEPVQEQTQIEEIQEEIIEEVPKPEPIPEPKVEEKKLEVIKKEPEKKVEKPKKIPEKKIPKKEITEDKKTTKKSESQQSKAPSNNSDDLIELSQGVFAAKNQGVQGLTYSFISQPDPDYPLAAKRISYNKEVSIKVRFLVGLNGEIEEVKFYNNKDSLGFQNEVEKTLKRWKLTPVMLNGKAIKLYFYKEFKFNQK
ncbi:MAG: energy transducer TonB [Cetobacterium sp.]|uniref:energy transducer TonB n=1 Tax=Cetobacterium sp. ZOR0034 TaxID=1339239 RepID=UPI00068CD7C6|nr:energy transducer TonB [Cetobacterium sp. ZOR0034]